MNMQNSIFKKKIAWFCFIAVCAFTLLLGLPSINNNINDPNMIVYLNADEGMLMDIIWLYYSGQKRESFQYSLEYGLEMLYLADFARLVLSNFICFTPTTFVLILRWIHLVGWIFSFFALWRLINYHFGNKWQPALAVILLAVRPAFVHASYTLKPDPLVLFVMIIGLDYALRIIKEPLVKRNLYIATACASIGFLIKYAGLFLLPAIVASIYFSKRYQKKISSKKIFPKLKISWTFPSLFGLILITFPLIFIIFYVRKSTGFTWYQQYGLWGSMLQNKFIFLIYTIGIFLIFLPLIIFFLNKINNKFFKKIITWINEINSHALIVCSLFMVFSLLFGFRWIITPQHFIDTYAQFGPSFTRAGAVSMISEKGLLSSFFQNIGDKIFAIDPIISVLFLFYLGMEIYYRRQNLKNNLLMLFKRLVLLGFLIMPFIVMFSMLRIHRRHMLPFFIAMVILAIQGLYIFNATYNGRRLIKRIVIVLVGTLFIADISINATETIKSRIYQFHQREDIAFELGQWWKENIPINAKIVADHYNCVYIPSGYKNLKTCLWNSENRAKDLRKLVNTYYPQFIYYNKGRYGTEKPMPSIEEILPTKRVKLIKSFDSAERRYKRCRGDKFVIYEILY